MKKKTLRQLRSEIASLDASILSSIQKRKLCAEEIAERKKAGKLPLRAKKIEEEVYKRNRGLAKKLGLEESFVLQITKLLIRQSVSWQKRYLKIKSQKKT
jgi:chorismate mutase